MENHSSKSLQNPIPTSKVIQVQNFITEINYSNLQQCTDDLVSSNWLKFKEGAKLIGRTLYIAFLIRPNSRKSLLIIIQNICRLNDLSYFIKDFKKELLDQIFIPFYESDPFPDALDSLSLLFSLYKMNIFSIKTITKRIYRMPLASRALRKSVFALCIIFSPELEEIDPFFFQKFISYMNSFSHLPAMFGNFRSMLSVYRADNWKIYRPKRDKISLLSPLLNILVEDNVEELIKYSQKPDFNPNMRFQRGLFEPFSFIQRNPTILLVSSAFGAYHCFRFLLSCGADVNLLDNIGQDLSTYAIIGGSIEIFRYCQQNGMRIRRLLSTAIEFHRLNMFNCLLSLERRQYIESSITNSYFDFSDNEESSNTLDDESNNDGSDDEFDDTELNNDTDSILNFPRQMDNNARQVNDSPDSESPQQFLSENEWRIIILKEVNNFGLTPIHSAAKTNYLDGLVTLLSMGSNINAKIFNSWTPIFFAVNYGSVDCIEYLISQPSCDPTILGSQGESLLHIAAQKCPFQIMKLILGHNINPLAKFHRRITFLQLAVMTNNHTILKNLFNTNFFSLLLTEDLKQGFSYDNDSVPYEEKLKLKLIASKQEGLVPINITIFLDLTDVLLAFLKNVPLSQSDYFSIASLSIKIKRIKCLSIILKETPIDINKIVKGFSLFHIACRRGNASAVQEMLPMAIVNQSSEHGLTPLHYAVLSGNDQTVQILTQYPEVDVNVKTSDNWSALDIACKMDFNNIIDILLKRKDINVNSTVSSGITPLMRAVLQNNIQAVSLFVTVPHLDINMMNNRGDTALHFATAYGFSDIVSILMTRDDLDVNVKNKRGLTAFQVACLLNNNEIMDILSSAQSFPVNSYEEENIGKCGSLV